VSRFHLRRPSPAMVVALAALFAALSGTAYAANTIRSTDIVDGQVKTADLANGAVTSTKLKDGGVATRDLAGGAVTAGKLGAAPVAIVSNSASESAAAATPVSLHADSETSDAFNMHHQAPNNQDLVVSTSGTYLVCADVEWAANSGGYRRTSIVSPNGNVATVAGPPLPSPAFTDQSVCGIEQLAGGQSVHVSVLQGSGAALNAQLTRFAIRFLGK